MLPSVHAISQVTGEINRKGKGSREVSVEKEMRKKKHTRFSTGMKKTYLQHNTYVCEHLFILFFADVPNVQFLIKPSPLELLSKV